MGDSRDETELKTKKLGVRELLKWAAPVAKAQVARKRKRERDKENGLEGRKGRAKGGS